MGSLSRPISPGKPGPSKVRADFSKRPASWVVRTPVAFLDARGNPLGHRRGWMLLILESYARSRAWCWVGNRELAEAFGASESTVQGLLRELEAEGLIKRVASPVGQPGRLGIILLRRADPDLPVADASTVADVERAMRDRGGRTRKLASAGPEKPSPERTQVSGGELRRSENEDESNDNEQPAVELTPIPPAPPVETRAGNEESSPPLNENEGNRIAGSGPLHPDTEAMVKRWLALGGTLAEQARRHLGSEARAARGGPRPLGSVLKPAPGRDTGNPDTLALLSRLRPGCDRGDVDRCVRRLCREFGDGHSQGFYTTTFSDVRSGVLPAEAVVNAYQRATGSGVRNRGAAFVAAVRGGSG
jgi:hypothetical protein